MREGSDNIRGGLWWIAARMGWENLWLGVGWGGFSSASFSRIDNYLVSAPASLNLVAGEHAHNIALNLLAELGIAAPLLLIATAGAWLWRTLRQALTPAIGFGVALILLLALHAQLEYTLWYTYFLGIGAIAVALAEPAWKPLPKIRPSMIVLVLASAFFVLLLLQHDYRRLENAMYWQSADQMPKQTWSTVIAELVDLSGHSQFGGYVDLTVIGAMPIDAKNLPEKLRVCESGLAFSPPDYAVFKCAALLAINDQPAEAERLFRKALAAYPGKAAATAAWLAPLVELYPQLAPLRDAAKRAAAT